MKKYFVFVLIFLFACQQKEEISESEKKYYSWLDTSFDAKADIAKGDIHLIGYGLKFPIKEEDSLTKKYGFYYDERGCSSTDTEATLTEIYNDQVIKYLEERNGKGWYDRFCFVYDSLDKVMWEKMKDTTSKK